MSPPSERSTSATAPVITTPAWRSVLEHIDGAVIVTTLDGTIVMANVAAQAYATTQAERVGVVVWELPELRGVAGEIEAYFRGFLAGDLREPYRLVLADGLGDRRVVAWHGTILRDDDGAPTHVLLTGQDVTLQERAEAALRERDALYRDAFERSDTIWWELDLEDGSGHWPEAARAFYGIEDASHASIELWRSTLHPEDREKDAELLQRLVAERWETFETLNRILHPTKGLRWIRSHGRVVYAPDGAAERLIGIDTDVTDRVEAEERLRQSESDFRALADSLPQIVWTAQPDGMVDYYNRRWTEFSGIEQQDGERVGWLPVLHPDDEAPTVAAWREAVAALAPYTIQHRVRRHDGAYRWHVSRALPVQDAGGRVTKWFGTATDVHDQQEVTHDLLRRSTQQAVVAELGIGALRTSDVGLLMQTALERLCEVLETDLCKVLRVRRARDGSDLVVEAAIGFPDAAIGSVVSSEEASPMDFTLRTSERLIVHDLAREPSGWPSPTLVEAGATSGISVVIHGVDGPYGVLGVYSSAHRTFDDADADFVQSIANVLAEAVKRRQTEAALEMRVRRLNALHLIETAITEGTDATATLRTIVGHVREQLGVDAAAVFTYRDDLHRLTYAAGAGFRTDLIRDAGAQLGEGRQGAAALERRVEHVRDVRDPGTPVFRQALVDAEAFRSYWGVPLVVKGELEGMLELFHRSPLDPEPGWSDFLTTLATQTALAINNARLFKTLQVSNAKLRLAYDATIEGWARALELKDSQTEGHSRRVTELSVRLAERLGVAGADLIDLKRGALLHDIGKMGIPDRILLKAGALSPEEWDVMRSHPTRAQELLTPIEFLRNAIAIPYAHHERWDGTGYPNGLSGEEIPLAARIFAVADVYDALTSERPYWPSWSRERALAYVRDEAGRHFDPVVARAFVALMHGDDRSVDAPRPDV